MISTHKHADMQQKLQKLSDLAQEVRLKINIKKTNSLRLNTSIRTPLRINQETIEDVEKFTYLGCTVARTGGTEEDIKQRINKARNTFNMLHKIWNAAVIPRLLMIS